MKKLFVLTMCAAAVSMTAGNVRTVYGAEDVPVVTEAPNSEDAPFVIAPNPVTNCTTLKEAESLAGFTINTPKKISGYGKRHISVIDNSLIQIIYGNNKKSLCIRKTAEESNLDSNSIQYEETKNIKIKGLQVTTYGENGKINSAIWTKNGFFYSIHTTSSLSHTKMKKIIKIVVNANIDNQDINISTQNDQNINQDNNVQIPNPFTDCTTLEEASRLTGFTLNVSETINEYELDHISVMNDEMIQVIYKNGENRLSIRKALGKDDISGDYNIYEEIKTMTIEDLKVTTRGANEKVGSAIWTDEKFTYSIFADSAISSEEVTNIIQMIMQ